MTLTVITLDTLSALPKGVTYQMTYEPPADGVAYAYQRRENGRKWRVVYFVVKEVEGER